MERDSMVFYRSFYEAVRGLPPELFKSCTLAILEYGLNGKKPEGLGIEYAICQLVKPQIDGNNRRYQNGIKGGRPAETSSNTSGVRNSAPSGSSGSDVKGDKDGSSNTSGVSNTAPPGSAESDVKGDESNNQNVPADNQNVPTDNQSEPTDNQTITKPNQSEPNPENQKPNNVYVYEYAYEKDNNKKTMCAAAALFERLWALYPSKRGKKQVSDAQKKRLLEVGEEELVRAIERYKSELKKDADWRKTQNGSTFFNSGYADYLDANFVPQEVRPAARRTAFHNFEERDTDYETLVLQQFANGQPEAAGEEKQNGIY